METDMLSCHFIIWLFLCKNQRYSSNFVSPVPLAGNCKYWCFGVFQIYVFTGTAYLLGYIGLYCSNLTVLHLYVFEYYYQSRSQVTCSLYCWIWFILLLQSLIWNWCTYSFSFLFNKTFQSQWNMWIFIWFDNLKIWPTNFNRFLLLCSPNSNQ